MPGQACAYKVGMMEMMSIRADAEKRLGDRFDIKAFHDVVLRNGAMPLAILRRVVDDWVQDVEARADDRCPRYSAHWLYRVSIRDEEWYAPSTAIGE